MPKNNNKLNSVSASPATSFESIMNQAGSKKVSAFSFSKTYPAYILLVLLIGLSFLIFKYVEQNMQSERKTSFDKAVSSVMTRFEKKYESNEQVLNSMRGLYDNLVQVVRDYFSLYGQIPARTYPSILSLMHIPKVENYELGEFIHYTMSQGLYTYKIFPEGTRNTYYPIEFIVPEDKNLHLTGYDLGTNEMMLKSFIKARDSNIIVSTPVFEVRKPDTMGFFILAPFYLYGEKKSNLSERRKNFEGIVAIEIEAGPYYKSALGSGTPTDSTIIFQVYDVDESGAQLKVFESENADLSLSGYKPVLQETYDVKIANRVMKVHFATIPNFGGQFQEVLPLLSFAISLVISFIFFGFILSVITSKARAENLAERMTRSQRRIVDSSQDIIAIMNLDGTWQSMNPASSKIFGYSPELMISNKIDILFLEDSDKDSFYKFINNAQDELNQRIDFQMKDVNGSVRWLSWDFTVSKTDGLIYSIGRDITLEKEAEAQANLRAKQTQLAEQFTREASEFKTYFMTKLSHQLRNSLTGILGYLQLITGKIYDSEEEMLEYVEFAEMSSEELFIYISDIMEVAQSDESSYKELSTVSVAKLLNNAFNAYNNDEFNDTKVTANISDDYKATAVADEKLLLSGVIEILNGMVQSSQSSKLDISITENSYEGATELQILTGPNQLVEEMINKYNANKSNLIQAIINDKNDIMLHLAIASSCIRMLNGNMKFDSLGEDGNLIQITLPLNKSKDMID